MEEYLLVFHYSYVCTYVSCFTPFPMFFHCWCGKCLMSSKTVRKNVDTSRERDITKEGAQPINMCVAFAPSDPKHLPLYSTHKIRFVVYYMAYKYQSYIPLP